MWTKEVPTTPGYYWFYGKIYGAMQKSDKMEIVRVQQAGPPEKLWTGYIVNGGFAYRNDFEGGFFQPLQVPEIPV